MNLKKITTIGDAVTVLFAFLAAVLLVFVTLAVTYEVITRYLFASPTTWVIEITEYCLLFITFLGMAWVLKNEWHVKVDLVLNLLNPRAQALVNTMTSILGVLISLALCWYGGRVSWDVFVRDYYQFAVLKIPYVYVISVIPIGSLLLLIQFLRRTVVHLQSWREGRTEESRSLIRS